MATDKSRTSDRGEFTFIGFTAFAVVVALFVFVSTKAGTRGVGLLTLMCAVLQQVKGRIPYGWEGRPPSGYITGGLALTLNVLLGGLGFAITFWPEVAMGIFGWADK